MRFSFSVAGVGKEVVGGSRKVQGRGGGYNVTSETHNFNFQILSIQFAKFLQKTPLT